MKKFLSWILILILAAALSTGCGNPAGSENSGSRTESESSESAAEPLKLVTILVNAEGMGEVVTAREGEEITFDDDFPSQYASDTIVEGSTLTIASRPDEGWQLAKWTKDGKFYSTEDQIVVTASEDTEYIAVFGMSSGYKGDGEPVTKVEDIHTMGDVFMLPYVSYSYGTEYYVYVFDLGDITYRAIAELPADVSAQIEALDFSDEAYQSKALALVAPLEVSRIENLTAAIPSQEELDQFIGKTGEDLLNDDWYCTGYNLDDLVFYMDHGLFSYTVLFDGKVENYDDFDQDEDLKPFVVKAIHYEGFGDPTNLDYTAD